VSRIRYRNSVIVGRLSTKIFLSVFFISLGIPLPHKVDRLA
jgi:hypothetical protein